VQEPAPHPSQLSVAQPAPPGHAEPAAYLHQQVFPRDTGLQHEQDSDKRFMAGDRPVVNVPYQPELFRRPRYDLPNSISTSSRCADTWRNEWDGTEDGAIIAKRPSLLLWPS
jgi:hypothetical protein